MTFDRWRFSALAMDVTWHVINARDVLSMTCTHSLPLSLSHTHSYTHSFTHTHTHIYIYIPWKREEKEFTIVHIQAAPRHSLPSEIGMLTLDANDSTGEVYANGTGFS